MPDDLFGTLVSALRDHDVPYDHDTLKAVYNDPESQTAVREWIEEYLTPDTLLTKDEAALYITRIHCRQRD